MPVVWLLFTASFAMAFGNVVIDAILVVQQRNDPENGSQDLFSIAYLFQGLGGVTGCIIAAFMTQDYHPKYGFLAFAIWGLILTISSCFLSSEAEMEQIAGQETYSHESSELLENQNPSEA
jgi:drug/metabolite transporter (DMT)-like permease